MPSDRALDSLTAALPPAIQHASQAFSVWLDRPATISVDRVERLSLPDAADAWGEATDLVCCLTVEFTGSLTGCMLIAFDSPSGLMLADLLLQQPVGTASEWGELEISAALETANIVCCACLNALAERLPTSASGPLLPQPPEFRQDFAASLLQAALMNQASHRDELIIAHAQFAIDNEAINGHLIVLPDERSPEESP